MPDTKQTRYQKRRVCTGDPTLDRLTSAALRTVLDAARERCYATGAAVAIVRGRNHRSRCRMPVEIRTARIAGDADTVIDHYTQVSSEAPRGISLRNHREALLCGVEHQVAATHPELCARIAGILGE